MAIPFFLQQSSLGGAAEITSFTVISSEKEGYNNAALAFFRNVQAGDLLFKMSSAGQENLTVRSLPSGWISLGSKLTGTYRFSAAVKIADGSESNTNTPNLLSGAITQTADYMLVIRPDVPLLSMSLAQSVWKSATDGSLGNSTLSASSMTTPTIFLGALHKDGTTANSSSEITATSGGSFILSDSSGAENTSGALKMGIFNAGAVNTVINHTAQVGGTYPTTVAASLNVTV